LGSPIFVQTKANGNARIDAPAAKVYDAIATAEGLGR
jgi:hypothetical protein